MFKIKLVLNGQETVQYRAKKENALELARNIKYSQAFVLNLNEKVGYGFKLEYSRLS